MYLLISVWCTHKQSCLFGTLNLISWTFIVVYTPLEFFLFINTKNIKLTNRYLCFSIPSPPPPPLPPTLPPPPPHPELFICPQFLLYINKCLFAHNFFSKWTKNCLFGTINLKYQKYESHKQFFLFSALNWMIFFKRLSIQNIQRLQTLISRVRDSLT